MSDGLGAALVERAAGTTVPFAGDMLRSRR
jgi:hypothetical protein